MGAANHAQPANASGLTEITIAIRQTRITQPMMLSAIFLLLVCQLIGEAIHLATGLPLPGAVIGMLLLLAWLVLVPRERLTLRAATGWLTAHLAVMFVPAAVGLIEEGPTLSRYGVGLLAATVASTLLTLIVTGLVFRWALARFAPTEDDAL